MKKRTLIALIGALAIASPARASGYDRDYTDSCPYGVDDVACWDATNAMRVYVDTDAYALRDDAREAIYVPVPTGACISVEAAPDTGARVVVFDFDCK